MTTPLKLSEEEVKLASTGRSEDVMAGKRGPVRLSEDEVKAAGQGRSKEILGRKIEKGEKKKE